MLGQARTRPSGLRPGLGAEAGSGLSAPRCPYPCTPVLDLGDQTASAEGARRSRSVVAKGGLVQDRPPHRRTLHLLCEVLLRLLVLERHLLPCPRLQHHHGVLAGGPSQTRAFAAQLHRRSSIVLARHPAQPGAGRDAAPVTRLGRGAAAGAGSHRATGSVRAPERVRPGGPGSLSGPVAEAPHTVREAGEERDSLCGVAEAHVQARVEDEPR